MGLDQSRGSPSLESDARIAVTVGIGGIGVPPRPSFRVVSRLLRNVVVDPSDESSGDNSEWTDRVWER